MEKQRQVSCADNEELAAFMWNKRKEMAEGPKGLSENVDLTLSKAYFNVCNSKNPIKTLKDFSQIKGVGKWILKLMQGFFDRDSGASENEELAGKGKRNKGTRRYVPQKNSVAYALLITLYRGTADGVDFMRKQELIDAADASGLSRVSIMPEKGKGKPGQFGSSPRDWYSGWNCMKTLVTKGMVVKSSCPAKYMLTEEGKEVARECLSRSGFVDSIESTSTIQMFPNVDQSKLLDLECSRTETVEEVALQYVCSSKQKKPGDIPPEFLDRFLPMGYFKEQIQHAFSEVSESFPNKEIASLWPSVLCRLREDEVYGFPMKSQKSQREKPVAPPNSCKPRDGEDDICIIEDRSMASIGVGTSDALKTSISLDSGLNSSGLRACSSTDHDVLKRGGENAKSNHLAMPPLSFGERFEDVYEVVLILDDREKFAAQGSKGRKIIEHIHTQFKIPIEVRRLPVGDGIWIARHKHLATEYVLDFIVERKNVDDLRSSIRDNRYKDQKVRLLRCGLKKMIYLVEGDPNASQAAESIKTACFTTEILEGFDVQRTSGLADTLKRYGYLTLAIIQYYRSVDPEEKEKSIGVCPPFNEFMRRCQDLDKVTVSDVFAIQLMQVPQVTEDVAIAVLDMYPTVLSLARAYALLLTLQQANKAIFWGEEIFVTEYIRLMYGLNYINSHNTQKPEDGDTTVQEEMLKKQSNSLINGVASRNIFQLVWGN